jgi:nucleoside-diphosphate-sugar epimerase
MKTIFITGESGTIPMAIQRIVSEGTEYRIINSQLEENSLSKLKTHQSFKVRKPEIDFLGREALLGPLWKDTWEQVDLIIHSGAFVGTDYCSSDPSLAIRTNVEGTQNIVDICNKYNIPLIYLSTTAILDPSCYDNQNPMTESTPINPQTLYGISKYAGELIVKNTCKTRRIVLRPVFGFGNYPDDFHSALTKVIYVLYRNSQGKKTNLTVLLDRLICKSYTRVENIANCILNFSQTFFAEKSLNEFSIFNIGENCTKSKDWFQLLKIIADSFCIRGVCSKSDINNIFNENIQFVSEKDYLHYHNMDDEKLKNIGFNFDSQKNYISIDQGISLTLDSVIKNIDQEPYWL